MSELISVVMPVRNGGEYLRPAVDSILSQTYNNLELIVVDDHSSDGAVERLRQSDPTLTEPRLKLLTSKGSGVVDAFNFGFSHSQGSFIARMDADDLALPERLQLQLDYFRSHADVGIVSCCVEFFSTKPILGGLKRYQKWLNGVRTSEQIHRQLFIESPMPNPGAIFRRPVLEQLGGYRKMQWPEDYDLYLRADAAGIRMGKPEQVLLRWREHLQRITHTDSVYTREQFMRAKAHFLVNHRLPALSQSSFLTATTDTPALEQSPIIWGAGPTGRLLHDLMVEQGGAISGFIEVHPRRIGGQKRGLPVWPIEKAGQANAPLVLIAVGAAGARKKIAEFMSQHLKIEGTDYLFVA